MINILFIFLIKIIRPFLGPTGCCKFELSCTDYAISQLNNFPFYKAFINIFKRIILCQPIIKINKNL